MASNGQSTPPQTAPDNDLQKQRQIAGMFDRIAPTYDRLNRILSCGTDKRWRRRLADSLRGSERVLDLASGTGDQLLEILERSGSKVFGLGADLSKEMLVFGREKLMGLAEVIQANATSLPLASEFFDAVTISFGIRNVVRYDEALKEMHRILKVGGTCVILEFGLPGNVVMRSGYLFYFRYILPIIGGWISGDRAAYKYLNQTVEKFPYGRDFAVKMEEAGFSEVVAQPLSGGIAYLYTGTKK